MQFEALTALRATMHRFILPEHHEGPFYYTLTDLMQNNVFDDAESVLEMDTLLGECFDAYEAEEIARNGALLRGPVMRHVWETGSFWYFNAVGIRKGVYRVFNMHVQPLFNKEHCGGTVFDRVFFWYWGVGAEGLIEKKLKDKEDYVARVKEVFEKAAPAPIDKGGGMIGSDV